MRNRFSRPYTDAPVELGDELARLVSVARSADGQTLVWAQGLGRPARLMRPPSRPGQRTRRVA